MAVKKRKDSNNRVLREHESQRANGTYEFKWTDKWGKRRAIYAKTLEELREKEKEVLRDIMDGIRTDKNSLTINDLYYRWEQLKKGLKANTFQNYKYMYKQFVEPDFGNSRIVELKRTDVRAFYNYLADERHIKANTIDSIHTVLHQVLELGVEDDYLRYNPSDNALKELKKAHNQDFEKRRALTQQEQDLLETFLSKGQYQRWYPIFIVMVWTGMRVGEIGYLFCDDEKILEVNREYLQHDYYTDIITFDYCDDDTINGDLVISLDTVRSNAEQFGKDYEEELHRVIIHGILHLCGIDDKGPGEREKMEAAENKALAMRQNL